MIPTKTINLDFWRHPTDILHLVQGEADGRQVRFKITDNGAAFDLTGFIAEFAVNKPDGNVVVNSATVTDAEGGIVDVVISSQVVAVAGNLHAELQIMKTGQLSKSFRIVTKVAPGVDIDGIAPSVSEFNALQTLIGQAETVISIADTDLWPEVVANAQYFSDLAGAGRTTETVKGNADEIADLAGAGRTNQTVKANADDITNLAGTGRTTETVKGAADAVTNLAGAGRNTETVKANADEIAALEAEIETARDGAATLGDALGLKADKLLLANTVTNGDFSDGGDGWEFYANRTQTYDVGYVKNLTNKAVQATSLIKQNGIFSTATGGDKFYFSMKFRANYALVINMPYNDTSQISVSYTDTGNWNVISGNYQLNTPNDLTDMVIRQSIRELASGDYYDIGNVLNINLTATFGAGNEPTAAEMDAIMAAVPDGWFDGTVAVDPMLLMAARINYLQAQIDEM